MTDTHRTEVDGVPYWVGPAETDTPRTDAEEDRCYNEALTSAAGMVDSDFARQLERELVAAKRDAERYRLLRSEIGRVDPMFSVVAKAHYQRNSSEWCNFGSAEIMDAAINAAMKERLCQPTK